VIVLVVPLLIVVATRNPQGVAHLVEVVFSVGAMLLNGAATVLSTLLGGH